MLNEPDETECSTAEMNGLQMEKNVERARRATNTGIPLIQSGHTFLQVIQLIIPEHSIAALNQTEL